MSTHDFSGTPVARTFFRRLVGLISRRDDSLFIPDCSSIHTWFVPHAIDVVFVDEKSVVLAIVADARPWRVFFGPRGTRSVLELPSGTAKQRELSTGDTVIGIIRDHAEIP